MENTKSSIALNLSDQANIYNSQKSHLIQFNIFAILGLGGFEDYTQTEGVPLSIDISKTGEITINGLSKETINDRNIYIYSDKKVTESEE